MTLTDTARLLLETGPVCDACLGRPFADRSFGLTNAQRGRGLRTTIALDDDADYVPVDTADCWVCEGYCGVFEAIATAVVDALSGIEFETYQVGTRVPPLVEENEDLFREEAGFDPDAGEPLNREMNREVGRRVGARTGRDVDFDRPDVLVVVDLGAFDPFDVLEDADGHPVGGAAVSTVSDATDGDATSSEAAAGPAAEGDATEGDQNPSQPATVTSHAIDVQVNPAFVYGRYRKLERDIPQTEWPCRECGGGGVQLSDDGETTCDHCGGSGYMYETSVEQVVRPHVVEAMDGDEGTFHGAGREDVDARMLEGGRPFVLEVKRPRRRTPDVEQLEREINEAAAGSVEVEGLRLATYEMVERVKELDASKHYRADVSFDEPVDAEAFEGALAALEGTTLEQYTPERVDHRRAGLTRERTVYDIDGTLHDPTTAEVRLHGEGGLYVKELIHGDGGRTEPSLAGLLGVGADVTALDVTGVEGQDEPFEQEPYFRDDPRE